MNSLGALRHVFHWPLGLTCLLTLLAQVTLTANIVCLNVWENDKLVKKVCRDLTGIVRSTRNGVREKGKAHHFVAHESPTAKYEGTTELPPTVEATLRESLSQPLRKRRRSPPLPVVMQRTTAAS